MLVQCPECNTKYNLDESKIGHDGSKVRCSRCKNVFTVFRPMTESVDAQAKSADDPAASLVWDDAAQEGSAGSLDEAKDAPASAKDSFEEDLAAMFEDMKPAPKKPSPADDFESDLAAMLDERKPDTPKKPSLEDDFEGDLTAMLDEKKPGPKAASKSSVDEDMIADLQGAFQQPLDATLDEESSTGDTRTGGSKKSGSAGLVVALVFVLLACAGAGIYFLKPGLIGLGPKAPGTPAITQEPAVREGAAQIALENVRQYFVPNEKEGQLFIIEGKAVNRFPEARELIRIKAALYDKQGNEVTTQEFMCGNVVSLYQLQVSTRADIEAALTAKVGILTNNTNIQSGASVPFMAVFFQTPDTVEEFGLEVIHSSVPQQ